MGALARPLAHAVPQTESIQVGGFGLTLLLGAPEATVVVQPEAWLLVPLEGSSAIVQELLRLHLLGPEVNTTGVVRVSAYDDAAGRADLLAPCAPQGATGQEEWLGCTHRRAGTTKKPGHRVEWAPRGGARDPV
jgi:hypothetical protein